MADITWDPPLDYSPKWGDAVPGYSDHWSLSQAVIEARNAYSNKLAMAFVSRRLFDIAVGRIICNFRYKMNDIGFDNMFVGYGLPPIASVK